MIFGDNQFCDKNDINAVNQEYGDAIDEIEGLVSASQACRIILCGDWNTAFERNNAQSKCLKSFIAHNNTYTNDSLGHRFCIDHFIVSKNIFNLIVLLHVLSNGINVSKNEYVEIVLENLRSNTVTHKAPVTKYYFKAALAWTILV